jgi:hypothetical protein
MIDVKEVRIGNLLNYTNEQDWTHVVEVIKIAKDFIYAEGDEIYPPLKCECYNPILITPEILVKCGFVEKKEYRDHYFINESIKANALHVSAFCIMAAGDEYHYAEYMYNAGIGDNEYATLDYFQPLKYLHQLQNFVFFMTGQELEIKLSI